MSLNFPANPTVGQIYTANGESWQWDGVAWNIAPEASTYTPVYVGATPPLNPASGNLWWNSVSGRLYLYYTDPDGSQWVVTSNPSNQLLEIDSDAVVAGLLGALTEYDDIAAASADGVPNGGLFKITGATDISGVRAVAFYV